MTVHMGIWESKSCSASGLRFCTAACVYKNLCNFVIYVALRIDFHCKFFEFNITAISHYLQRPKFGNTVDRMNGSLGISIGKRLTARQRERTGCSQRTR